MNKDSEQYTEIEKEAQKWLDKTDIMQLSTLELLTMFHAHQLVKNNGVLGDVSESLLDKLSDRKDMAHKELKSTINVDYFSFVGGWTLAIEAVKKLSERVNSR